MRRVLCLSAVLACLPLGGCIAGAIYQHTVEPLDVNLTETPVGVRTGDADVKDLTLSYVRIMWDGNDVAGAAKEAGIDEVFYADRETFQVLGIWRQEYVHIYGR